MPCSMLSPKNLCPSVAASGVTVTDITKLLVHRRSMFARWLSTATTLTIYGSVPVGAGSIVCDMWGLFRHNMPSTASVRLQLYAAAFAAGTVPSGTATYDKFGVPASNGGTFDGMSTWALAEATTPRTFRSYVITISGLTSGVNYVFGDLFFGKSLPLDVGFSRGGSTFSQLDAAQYAIAQSGGLLTKSSPALRRRYKMQFDFLDAAARTAVMQAEADNPSGVYMLAVYPDVLTGVGVQDDIAKRKAAEGTFLGRLLDSIAPTFEVNVSVEVGVSEI